MKVRCVWLPNTWHGDEIPLGSTCHPLYFFLVVGTKKTSPCIILLSPPGNNHISPTVPFGTFESMIFRLSPGEICFLVPWSKSSQPFWPKWNNISPTQISIDFPEISENFSSSATIWGEVVWGRCNLTRTIQTSRKSSWTEKRNDLRSKLDCSAWPPGTKQGPGYREV